MKCVSFNINSVRIRLHQLQAIAEKYQPDFIGLQETKVIDEEFPTEAINELGYHVEYFGQKTHYGVALLSRYAFNNVQKGFIGESSDAQRRFIQGEFNLENGQTLIVMNGYFPQGENASHPTKYPNKAHFYHRLTHHIQNCVEQNKEYIVMGDMNVAPTDKDIGIGEANRKRWLKEGKCSFLPEERDWFDQLLACGLHDTFRKMHPEESECFSWFDYRSKGFEREPKRGLRIDFVLASPRLAQQCKAAGIDYEIRAMAKPSDHCPVFAEFEH